MNRNELQKRPMVIRYELLEHYNELGFNESELIIFLKILYHYDVSNEQPSINVLKKGTHLTEPEITAIIQKYIQLGLLSMKVEKNNDGKFTEYIDLEGFYTQFSQLLNNISHDNEQQNEKEQFKTLFNKFENAFGRTLSPLEIEHLNQWIDVDDYSIPLIDAALNEALAHEKYSLKYIDRILLNWKKNNVRTPEESQPIRAQFKKQSPSYEQPKTIENIPKFNWLKGENPFDK
ncbi:DnaD domain-containing protein [Staphylococcus canis]|uniref:DnaD domain protein n=1 Tax=Staphylococcus canis TaxID=2724942 RepID=A0ABS0T9E2_9STAP|nr:DnaD domain protein [Staphylococcus canis]MBI5975371.1 DnaD domain protein [Staphylococcus canis]